ncbi:MAG: hypothetical protein CTY35_09570, partial [Methylotenera sp.]
MTYDPVRPQMERLKGMERAYILMHSTHRPALQKLLTQLVDQLRSESMATKVRWAVDVNPLEF